jgi:hypothetical protein
VSFKFKNNRNKEGLQMTKNNKGFLEVFARNMSEASIVRNYMSTSSWLALSAAAVLALGTPHAARAMNLYTGTISNQAVTVILPRFSPGQRMPMAMTVTPTSGMVSLTIHSTLFLFWTSRSVLTVFI